MEHRGESSHYQACIVCVEQEIAFLESGTVRHSLDPSTKERKTQHSLGITIFRILQRCSYEKLIMLLQVELPAGARIEYKYVILEEQVDFSCAS